MSDWTANNGRIPVAPEVEVYTRLLGFEDSTGLQPTPAGKRNWSFSAPTPIAAWRLA